MSQLGDDAVVRSVEGLLEGRPDDSDTCLNCEASLHGVYCSECGQKASGIDVSMAEFARDALDNMFSFDSRVWVTLRYLVMRPGFLSVEYWEGRRARYVAPLRLYLFVSFISFLLLGLVAEPQVVNANASWEDESGRGAMVKVSSGEGEGDIDWEEDVADAPALLRWFTLDVVRPIVENQERVQDLFLQRLPWAVFLMVPFFAVLLRLLFRKQKRYLVAHLVFSLHIHAVAFLLLVAGGIGDALSGGGEGPSNLASLLIFFLLVLALRRAYANSWVKTLLKALILVFVHILALGIVLMVTIVLTALSL